jgi:hypothetical protein
MSQPFQGVFSSDAGTRRRFFIAGFPQVAVRPLLRKDDQGVHDDRVFPGENHRV